MVSKIEEEVTEALKSYDGSKSPGLDEMNFNFIKGNRKIIMLILKCNRPESMKDFRPIILVSPMYKLLAEVLSNRLKKVIRSIIGEVQLAFVSGRQIIDGFIITDEIFHKWKKDKNGGLLVKLDFEKAYDSVDHGYLDFMMGEMGFVDYFPMEQFGIEQGLHQGDPLSPFLFNIAIDGFHRLFMKANELDLIRGVVFDDNNVHISHLQFVDDTMVFLQPRLDYLLNAKRILRCFELSSGLRMNSHKSCVTRIGKVGTGEEDWAKLFLCKQGSLPITYLG
ncbi:hypothetical protein Dsin_002268 [Dipteronia sinensis]|uniref:Reverse transcriptase domain-containing protein n=1 Tax=Dipteronia sinensis TaxID=43782 RepID=A0AAE0B5T1_9ROSI|nr:hypothetical protein Dsin_002268 [Dipteronia sinensis]